MPKTMRHRRGSFLEEEPDTNSDEFEDAPNNLGDNASSNCRSDGEVTEWSEDGSVRPIRKIHVGNLDKKTLPYDLKNFFRRFGRVIDAHITKDKNSGIKRNFGFVTFRYPADARKALKAAPGELNLYSTTMCVSPACSWHQPEETPDGSLVFRRRVTKNRYEVKTNKFIELRNQSLIEVDEKLCKIDILNDDCLMHIFSFLSKKELVKVERVCKRWQEVSNSTWKYVRYLNYENMYSTCEGTLPNVNSLRCFLKRCGPHLVGLDLSYRPNDFSSRVLSVVVKLAPQLQCLNLSGLPLGSYSLNNLHFRKEKIKRLNLSRCLKLTDHDLLIFFLQCKELESVVLSGNSQLAGKCLTGLSQSKLTELVMDDCINLRSHFLVTGLRNLQTLTHLSLNSCVNLISSDFVHIIQSLPQLKDLSLANYFPLLHSSALCSFEHLKDLVSLNLEYNTAINDQVIGAIAANCVNLEKLNVSGCTKNIQNYDGGLTNEAFHLLARLRNLVDLSMSYLAVVTNEALNSMAVQGKLKRLECRGCPKFTDTGCMSVVSLCGELECFDFSGCGHVTDATVECALEAVKERNNSMKLKIIAGGTKVRNYETSHPLLEVNLIDLSLPQMIPNYDHQSSDSGGDDDDDDDDDDQF